MLPITLLLFYSLRAVLDRMCTYPSFSSSPPLATVSIAPLPHSSFRTRYSDIQCSTNPPARVLSPECSTPAQAQVQLGFRSLSFLYSSAIEPGIARTRHRILTIRHSPVFSYHLHHHSHLVCSTQIQSARLPCALCHRRRIILERGKGGKGGRCSVVEELL